MIPYIGKEDLKGIEAFGCAIGCLAMIGAAAAVAAAGYGIFYIWQHASVQWN